jgi:hypothetical protein
MQKILLILAIAFSATLFGQQDKTYYIDDLTSINDNTSKKVESYVSLFSHDLNRNTGLDKRAKLRNSYFISVVQQTSKSGELFSSMLDSIPDGRIGHTKCFGRSGYFVPAEVGYPELFPNLYDLNLKVDGEIMYQVAWSKVLNERQTSNIELVQKAATAGIPVIAAIGAPSSLAVELAKKMNIKCYGFVKEKRWNNYTPE